MTMRAYGSGGAGLFPTSVAGFENRAGRFRFVNFSEKWSVLTSMSARVRGRVFPSLVLTGVYPVTESPVLPPDVRDHIMSAFYGATCPKCKTMTMLARNTPGTTGFDIRTFECPACEDVHQRVVELVDPMKSRTTAGWLRGELRAPT
jgi:hypothetical protein